MLQAMNTGHDGSLTTIHANSPRDALYRLDTMVAMADLNIPDRAVRQQVASAVNLVVQLTRLSDGQRRVTAISEITGMEQDVITMQDIYLFERTGLKPDGRVSGVFSATGIRPKCAQRAARPPASRWRPRCSSTGWWWSRGRSWFSSSRPSSWRCRWCSAPTGVVVLRPEAADRIDRRGAAAQLQGADTSRAGSSCAEAAEPHSAARPAATPAEGDGRSHRAAARRSRPEDDGGRLHADAASSRAQPWRSLVWMLTGMYSAAALAGAVGAFAAVSRDQPQAHGAAAHVRRAVSRGHRSHLAGAARRPRLHHRPRHGRGRDSRAGRPGVPAPL